MKDTILRILRNGYVRTNKYSLEDLARRFYPITRIAKYDKVIGGISCNDNTFWSADNQQNRMALYHELAKSKAGIKGMYFILNRYENGDKYGIA